MPDFSSMAQHPLKIIFGIHFVLVSWGIQGRWCPQSVMMYNLLFFLCLLWAVHNVESDEPLQFALIINVISICLDVITLIVYFPNVSPYYGGAEKFSAAILIVNTIVRVATSVFLLRIGQARGGFLSTIMSGPAMGLGRQEYEDISHPVPQNSDFVGI